MKSRNLTTMGSLDKLDILDEELQKVRGNILTEIPHLSKKVPLAIESGNVDDFDIDPMVFPLNEWVTGFWPEIRCKLIGGDCDNLFVLCDISKPVKLSKHRHPKWKEKLVMIEGELLEHTTGVTHRPNGIRYSLPAGSIHEPEFTLPTKCIIVWYR